MQDYDKLNSVTLQQELVKACQNNDVASVKHLLTFPNQLLRLKLKKQKYE